MLIWKEDGQWYIHLTDGLVYTTFDEDIVINNCPFCGEKLEWQIMNVNII